MVNFALSCLRLGHKVTILTAKSADKGSSAAALQVEVVPLDSLLGSRSLGEIVWLPAVCAYLCLAGRRYDFAVVSAAVAGVFAKAVAADAVLCVPAEQETSAGLCRMLLRHLLQVSPLQTCRRRLRKCMFPYWTAVLVEEGARCEEPMCCWSDPKVLRVAAPALDVSTSSAKPDVPLESLGISLPSKHYFVAFVNCDAEAEFLLSALAKCCRPSLVLISPKPLTLDVGDLPVLAVAGESSQISEFRRAVMKRAAAYVHTAGASRAALADALLLKRPVIAYGDSDGDLLLGPHAMVVERDPSAVAGAFLHLLHIAETDSDLLENLGDAAQQRVYHLARVPSFDRNISDALNPAATRVQVQKPPESFWQSSSESGLKTGLARTARRSSVERPIKRRPADAAGGA